MERGAKMKGLHICSFDAVGEIKRGTSYESFKAMVLQAGRFSVFEAGANERTAKLYMELCADPTVEIDNSTPYPWTTVREVPK
jgi:hypothetical protein